MYPEYETTIKYCVAVCSEPSPAVHCWTASPLESVVAIQLTTLSSAGVPSGLSAVSVTRAEMSCDPDSVVPLIVKFTELVPLAVRPAVIGVMVIEVTTSAAVAVVVEVIEPEAAVMVVVPAERPVNRPPVVMDATVGEELDQHTLLPVQLVPPARFPVLPSL